MLTSIHLKQFKNFQNASLSLGSLTLLVGTNGSGKSNIREALRFLHGISRGYTLAEIIGEKWIEGGVLQWRGIRGGTREITFEGRSKFEIFVHFQLPDKTAEMPYAEYSICVKADRTGIDLRVISEYLHLFDISRVQKKVIFDSNPAVKLFSQDDPFINVLVPRRGRTGNLNLSFLNQRPILSQFIERSDIPPSIHETPRLVMDALSSMRFLDLSPDAMRIPSLPGQTILGDRGENLSSVLQAICQKPDQKQVLLQWIRELTPMDAQDFEFPSDFTGKILLTLVEENGQKTSAYSASDGTLRFLAIIAALLGSAPAQFYFFEELENGIHPARLHLLLQLIEKNVNTRNIQIVATTHSPQLLGLLSKQSLDYAALIYRIEGTADARIKRILDIPEAKRVIEEQDLVRLHASGWLEDAVEFMASAEAST